MGKAERQKEMKKLSIIVPMYISEAYLPKCLDSLLNQDIPHEDYEIILVDDGSPDGSKALAEDYASRFSNIVVLSQENKGTSGARNTGLRYASGKYVYFVDPDDYILENSLHVVLDQMEKESLDALRFGFTEVDEQYNPTRSNKNTETADNSPGLMDGAAFMAERLGVACYVWTFLFRTAIIKENGIYFIEGDYYDDTPWLPRVLLKAERVDSIDFNRHFYLIRSNSLVQSNSRETLLKKIKGQHFLIEELTRQRSSIDNANATRWYDRIISHCVWTMLSYAAMYGYDETGACVSFLKRMNLYPVSMRRKSFHSVIKAALFNVSPRLFCMVMLKRVGKHS